MPHNGKRQYYSRWNGPHSYMYEKLVEYVKVESKELNDNVVFSYGDLFVAARRAW
jgi:hypothetical protein